MPYIPPKRYPHHGRRIYTRRGFRHRLRPRLLAQGYTSREVDRLEQLYFGIGLGRFLDERGLYLNVRRQRLYYMARGLKADRKHPIFELVRRSGMFYCYLSEDKQVMAFSSPYLQAVYGCLVLLEG